MKKLMRFIMVTMIAMVTVCETAKSQISIQTFTMEPAAIEHAKQLESFYSPGVVITKEDSCQKVEFSLVCCSDGVMKIYFPQKTRCNCPVLTLYRGSNGEFRTEDLPSGYTIEQPKGYSAEQTERQIKDIQRALWYLKS